MDSSESERDVEPGVEGVPRSDPLPRLAQMFPSDQAVEEAANAEVLGLAARRATLAAVMQSDAAPGSAAALAGAKRRRLAQLKAEMMETGYQDPWAPDRVRGATVPFEAAVVPSHPSLHNPYHGDAANAPTTVARLVSSHHVALSLVFASADGLSDDSEDRDVDCDAWAHRTDVLRPWEARPSALNAVLSATMGKAAASVPGGYADSLSQLTDAALDGGTSHLPPLRPGATRTPLQLALASLATDSALWSPLQQDAAEDEDKEQENGKEKTTEKAKAAPATECFVFGDSVLTLPSSIVTLDSLADVLNEQVFQSLSSATQAQLMTHLPGEHGPDARRALLTRQNIHFGSPLVRVERQLRAGELHPLTAARSAAGRAGRRALWEARLLEWERRVVAGGGARLARRGELDGAGTSDTEDDSSSVEEDGASVYEAESLHTLLRHAADAASSSDSTASNSQGADGAAPTVDSEARARTKQLAERHVDPNGTLSVNPAVLDAVPDGFSTVDSEESDDDDKVGSAPGGRRLGWRNWVPVSPSVTLPAYTRATVLSLAPGSNILLADAGFPDHDADRDGRGRSLGLPTLSTHGGGAAGSPASSSRRRSAGAATASPSSSGTASAGALGLSMAPSLTAAVPGGAYQYLARQTDDLHPLRGIFPPPLAPPGMPRQHSSSSVSPSFSAAPDHDTPLDRQYLVFPLFQTVRSILIADGPLTIAALHDRALARLQSEVTYFPLVAGSTHLLLSLIVSFLGQGAADRDAPGGLGKMMSGKVPKRVRDREAEAEAARGGGAGVAAVPDYMAVAPLSVTSPLCRDSLVAWTAVDSPASPSLDPSLRPPPLSLILPRLQQAEAVFVFLVSRGYFHITWATKDDAPATADGANPASCLHPLSSFRHVPRFDTAAARRRATWASLPLTLSDEEVQGLRERETDRYQRASVGPEPVRTVTLAGALFGHAVDRTLLALVGQDGSDTPRREEPLVLPPTRPPPSTPRPLGISPILSDDRLANATLLVSLSDALGRLPGGVGTKKDLEVALSLSLSLKPDCLAALRREREQETASTSSSPSVFVAEDEASDASLLTTLSTTTSAALDRLSLCPSLRGRQNEKDDYYLAPLCRFDHRVGLWMYLGRRWGEEELTKASVAVPGSAGVALVLNSLERERLQRTQPPSADRKRKREEQEETVD